LPGALVDQQGQAAETLAEHSVESKLAVISSNFGGQRAEDVVSQDIDLVGSITAWSQQRSGDIVASMPPEVPLSETLGAVPLPVASPDFDCIEWVPPGSQLASRALARQAGHSSGLDAVRSAWAQLHEPIKSKDSASLGRVRYESRTVCQRAGYCLHQGNGPLVKSFVEQVVACLRTVLAKDTLGRYTYDGGRLVLRLSAVSQVVWVHVGYGNLNTYEFSVLPLVSANELQCRIAQSVGEVALSVSPELPQCGVGNLWQVFRHLRFP
jgi:hypothetical protein